MNRRASRSEAEARPGGKFAVTRGGLEFPDVPSSAQRHVVFRSADAATIVVGRAQQLDVVGVPVIRRLSGGGAVWLEPDAVLWADVIVPRDDPLWDDDVARAALWLGEAWVRTLALPDAEVHRRGTLACTPWCPMVCFAGMGPGEVHVGGRKAVGISQRRTRHGALFQCAVNLTWDPEPLVRALRLPDAAIGDLQAAVLAVDVARADLEDALLQQLDAAA